MRPPRFSRATAPTWRLLDGHRPSASGSSSWSVHYERFASAFPDLVRISTTPPPGSAGVAAVLSLEVSQRETNIAIDPRAFDAVAAPDATADHAR